MNHTYALGLFIALSIVSPLSAIRAAEPSNVLLSEIAWAGSEKSTADEWLEIRNVGNESVDVSGWTLTGAGSSGSPLTLPTETLLASNQSYLVANYAVGDKSTLIVAPDMVTTTVSIPNTALNITLVDANGNVVDTLIDAGAPDFGSSTTFATMKRDFSGNTWFTETASSNAQSSVALVEETPPLATSDTPAAPSETTSTSLLSDPEVALVDTSLPTSVSEIPVVPDPAPITESVAPSVSSESVSAEPITSPIPDLAPPIVTVEDVMTSVLSEPVIETLVSPAPEALSSPTAARSVIITGLLPSPNTGNDEWVMLKNTTSASIDLGEFTLVDASGNVTVLSGILEPNTSVSILNPEGHLNNDADSIALMSGDVLIDVVSYGTDAIPAPKKNAALTLVESAWITSAVASSAVVEEVSEAAIESVTPVVNEPLADATSILPTPIETSETVSAPASTVQIGDVIFTEVLPAPSAGNDEWIELYNATTSAISLDGLSLIDASGAATLLTGALDASSYTLIANPKGNLNNESESIALMNGETVLDAIVYGDEIIPAPKRDSALALIDGAWIAATPTPAAANTVIATENLTPTLSPTLYDSNTTSVADAASVVTAGTDQSPSSTGSTTSHTNTVAAPVKSSTTTHSNSAPSTSVTTVAVAASTPKTSSSTKAVAKTSTKKSTASTKAAPRSVTVDAVASLADDTLVTLEGIVVAEVGILGKRSFFLDGLEVYQGSGELADVHVGDRVTITGKVSVLTDRRRVNIQEGDASVRGSANPITHDYTPDLPYGSLARVTGIVSARDGNAILLQASTGATIKLVPGNGVTFSWTDIAGATITVTGIIKHGEQETLVLRSANDLVVEKVSEPIAAATIAATSSSQTSMFWAVGALLAVASAGFGLWVWYTRPTARTTKLILNPTTV